MDDYTSFYLYIVPDTVRAHESSKPKGSFHELSFARSERCARSDLKFIRVKSLSSNEINRKERHDIRNKSQAKLKRKNPYGISIIVSCPLQKMHVSAKSLKLDTRHIVWRNTILREGDLLSAIRVSIDFWRLSIYFTTPFAIYYVKLIKDKLI